MLYFLRTKKNINKLFYVRMCAEKCMFLFAYLANQDNPLNLSQNASRNTRITAK